MRINKNIAVILLMLAATSSIISSCYKEDAVPEASDSPTFNTVTPTEGSGGTLVTVSGKGLANMKSVVFANQNVPTVFNPALNSEENILFRVPDTAYGGDQDIILTNTLGKQIKVPFKVLALASVTGVSAYEFEGGSSLTLKGNNLESVTAVVLDGTTDAATIVTKSRREIVLTMPASNVNRAKLKITNGSGVIVTTQEFANLAKAFVYFKDGFAPSVEDWSWCGTHVSSTEQVFMGTHALKAIYGNGAWQGVQFRYGPKVVANDYAYFSFWVKGGNQDNNLKIYSDDGGTPVESTPIPKEVWTYIKIPIQGFMNGVNIEKLVFQMRGPDNSEQTIFFDNVIFVK